MKKLLGVVITLAAALVVGMLLREFVFGTSEVAGDSMKDTLMHGDTVLITWFDYELGTPKRGDIAQLEVPGRGGLYLKRVIGLPGETVEIINGVVHINGQALDEPYAVLSDDDYYIELGQDDYFVLGDNRPSSYDSREEDFGVVSADCFLGRVRAVVWPAGRIDFGLN